MVRFPHADGRSGDLDGRPALERSRERIATNRLAAAAVVASHLTAALVAILYRLEALDVFVPERAVPTLCRCLF